MPHGGVSISKRLRCLYKTDCFMWTFIFMLDVIQLIQMIFHETMFDDI